MKKQMDKLQKTFIINKQITTFLLGLSIVAIIAGTLYLTILNETDQQLINKSIGAFFNEINNNNFNYAFSLKNTLLINISFIILIWLLGISVIGVPIIVLLFFSKLFTLGFSISSIIFKYKLKGSLLALIYIFPHHIINIYIYVIVIAYSISLSLKIITSILKKETIDFKLIMNKYVYILIIAIVVIIITALIETFITPNLLKLITI